MQYLLTRLRINTLAILFLNAMLSLTLQQAGPIHAQNMNNDIQYIREQAEIGDPEAQFSLALMLDQGDRIEMEKQEAVTWFTRAAEQNLAGACLYLAIKYEYGNTVEQDVKKAAHWYRKAALQGWPSAQYFLGMLHLSGKKIPVNRVKAFTWLSLAAEQDYPNAQIEKNNILFLLSEIERLEAEQMIQDYIQALRNDENSEQQLVPVGGTSDNGQ